jgi:hypothetical protein
MDGEMDDRYVARPPDDSSGSSTPPDTIPDDVLKRFGDEARHAVRYRKSRRYRVFTNLRSGIQVFRDGEVWTTALVIFGISAVALLFIGALAYTVVLWPPALFLVVLPVCVLMPLSFWVASRMVRKERPPEASKSW